MPQHHTHHLQQLQALRLLSDEDVQKALSITDFNASGYVASEVLAIIVRSPSGRKTHLYRAAAECLHHRIFKGVYGLLKAGTPWERFRGDAQTVEDTVMSIWEALLDQPNVMSNAERYFRVFLKNRTIDHLRSLITLKASQPSYDGFKPPDPDAEGTSYVHSVADDDEDGPLETAIRDHQNARIQAAYLALPREERNAVYYRLEQEQPWQQVAEFLQCSIPTARARYRAGVEKLKGEL